MAHLVMVGQERRSLRALLASTPRCSQYNKGRPSAAPKQTSTTSPHQR